MEAGSDTTSSTLQSWVILMTQHQDILGKMQDEVDRLCGTERMPTPDDITKLPFVRAVMTEVRTETIARFVFLKLISVRYCD